MEFFAVIALVCWGLAHILIMACTRHIGMDNRSEKVVKLDIWNVRRLKPMFPPAAYRVYVTAHALFFIGALLMAVRGVISLAS